MSAYVMTSGTKSALTTMESVISTNKPKMHRMSGLETLWCECCGTVTTKYSVSDLGSLCPECTDMYADYAEYTN